MAKGKWYHLTDSRRPGKRMAHAWLVLEGVERYLKNGWTVDICTCPNYAEWRPLLPAAAEPEQTQPQSTKSLRVTSGKVVERG